MSARDTALSVLIACRKGGAWSDGALKEAIARDRLDSRDAALASRLCYGVLQNRMLLDFQLRAFVRGDLRRLQPVVLEILRLGAYQLTQLDRVPASAAVNEAVEQGKRRANARAAGLINGVLRAMARAGDALPQPADLATRYSHPTALVELLRENVGEELLEPLLASNNESPETVVQVNPLKTTERALREAWEGAGVSCTAHPWMPGCCLLRDTGRVEAMACFRAGEVLVQDAAARLAVTSMGLRPGMRVLDCCAAPGGKSFAAAMELQNQGSVFSCDIHPHKLALIEKGAQRLGITCIQALEQDAASARAEWLGQMDAVIADVPCSGLGVIRKKPDIRYKDLEAIQGLPAVQRRILGQASAYVRPGGALLYSTCTILKRENEEVVDDFLHTHPDFLPEPLALPPALAGAGQARMTLLPCLHGCDGFFLAKLRRRL
ncbi:MAG: 16S rRNA (cytosine(967)-C(5))-methyltransferase RsmB [Oscillospiraceae bacterium]|nr:16S rRNA (cytosine(967)-C(5))-methyltransferase RsmB [Oscillospiraceae bacterium]